MRRRRSSSGSKIIELIGPDKKVNSSSTAIPIAICILLLLITIQSRPSDHPVSIVWWYGWLTALFTGLGTIPFAFCTNVEDYYLGLSNGVAAGMMMAASMCLFYEGLVAEHGKYEMTLVGVLIGIGFIYVSKLILDKYEDLKVCSLSGIHFRKAMLIVAVMTLHSFSEGVGIGVAFGGSHGVKRGVLISTSLAVHNIPEGLAIGLVLVPRGVHYTQAGLWAIFTSLPQPIMSVLAFTFVNQFTKFLPCGMGFAAGAMAFVAIVELLPEAFAKTKDRKITLFMVLTSGIAMSIFHEGLHMMEGI